MPLWKQRPRDDRGPGGKVPPRPPPTTGDLPADKRLTPAQVPLVFIHFADELLPKTGYNAEMGAQMLEWVDLIVKAARQDPEAYDGLDQFALLLAEHGYSSEAQSAHMIARESGRPDVAARAAYRLGRTAAKSGDTRSAKFLFDEVVASADSTWAPHAALGLVEMNLAAGDYRQAEHNLVVALGSTKDAVASEAAYNLGVVRRDFLDDLEGADVAFQKGIDHGDPEWVALCATGQAIVRERLGDNPGAERAYEIAVSANHPEESPKAAFNLGLLRYKHGDYSGAIAANEIAIASGNEVVVPVAAYHLGMAKEKVGDYGGAESAYLIGIKSGQQDARAGCAYRLGALYIVQRHDYGRGCEAFQLAIQCNSPKHSPRAAFNLAIVQKDRGNIHEAVKACQTAVDSGDPEFAPRALQLLKELTQRQ